MNEEKIPILLEVNIIVTGKNDLPAIEIRRLTTDCELMKIIISCAIHNQPITVMPKFTNPLQSLNTLVSKGVLYKKDNEYFSNI